MSRPEVAYERFLDALEAHGERVQRSDGKAAAQCPAHEDRHESLSVMAADGRVLVHCHAGCVVEDVVAAVGWGLADLFERDGANGKNGHREIVATYDYVDEAGELLYQVVRVAPKDFPQRRPDGAGGWIWNLRGIRRVLYRLPKVIEAVKAGKVVYVAEGEKDVHALERAGAVATCNPGGARKWRDEYARVLAGAEVVVVADRDKAGRKHAAQVAASLRGVAASVTVVEAATGKDAAEHLAAGHTVPEFARLNVDTGEPTTNGAANGRPLVIRASSVKSRAIRWAWKGRIALGYLTVVTGEEGLGKSVFAAWQIARTSLGELEGEWQGEPVTVLVIASEDGIADTWRPRLDLAGADLVRVAFLAVDELGSEWNLRDGSDAVRGALAETGARFIYIDCALDHMPAPKSGESINSPAFVRAALGPLRTLVRDLDIAAEFSMHPPKARGANYRDLVQASQAFTAIPRIGLLLAWHPEDDQRDPDRRRVLIRGKGNLGRDPGALEFRVVGRDHLHDDGVVQEREVVEDVAPSGVTLTDLRPAGVMGEREPTKVERAAEIIAAELADGAWHEAQPIRDRLHAEHLNHNSVVADAKRRIGVDAEQISGVAHGGWVWRRRCQGQSQSGVRNEGSADSETLTSSRARRYSQPLTLMSKERESAGNTVRVSESGSGDGGGRTGGQSQSPDELRARGRSDHADLLAPRGVDTDPVRRLERLARYDASGARVLGDLLGVDPAAVPDLPEAELFAAFPVVSAEGEA